MGYSASCSVRKALMTTLGVVLTLSVMWICRPNGRPMPSTSWLTTLSSVTTVEPTLATVIATVRRYHRVRGRNKQEKHGLPGSMLQLGSQIKHMSSRYHPSHNFNVTLNDNTIVQARPVKQLKVTYDRKVPPENNGSDVFMSVRTTTAFHKTRLHLLLHTWLQTVDPKQVQIVTDSMYDKWINEAKVAGFRVTMAYCDRTSHERLMLCCKTGCEFEQYYRATETGKRYRWYCHFDDDEYVNIPVLMRTLHAHKDKLYLGHWPSRQRGSKKMTARHLALFPKHRTSSFYYATGAAYCISSTIMPQLERYVRSNNTFVSTCKKLSLPDDVAVGALIEAILGYNLTDVSTMYSQNNKEDADHTFPKDWVTIGYKLHRKINSNFTRDEDHTGFLSYHCLLYPSTPWCRKRPNQTRHRTV